MSELTTIVHVEREAVARLLVAALEAHGFSPRAIADGGLPGLGTGKTEKGIPIMVPGEEAADAEPLARALLADMTGKPTL